MNEEIIKERLRQVQARVKVLNSSREKIIGDARVEEQKLKTAYNNLKELGITDPEGMTTTELRQLETSCRTQLEEKLAAIETQLAEGDKLIKKYNDLQETA